MKICKCEHWAVCPICKPEWYDNEGNRLPPEPTPLQAANGRIEELEQQLAEQAEAIDLQLHTDARIMELEQQLADAQKQIVELHAEVERKMSAASFLIADRLFFISSRRPG